MAAGNVCVYFQSGMAEEARVVAADVAAAERDILAFWGRSEASAFDFPVEVYLCRDRDRFWHLLWNHAKAAASGNDLLIHATYPAHERRSFLTHELAHLFVYHELGRLRALRSMPAWLDEGIATTLQSSAWNDRNGLRRFLEHNPELAPLTSVPSVLRWRGAVAGGGHRAGAQYAYVRAFTEDLIERHGRRRVLDYLVAATSSSDIDGAFERSFGLSLAAAESQWIDAATRSGLLPQKLRLVDRGLPLGLLAKLALLAAAILLSASTLLRGAARLLHGLSRRPQTRRPGPRLDGVAAKPSSGARTAPLADRSTGQ